MNLHSNIFNIAFYDKLEYNFSLLNLIIYFEVIDLFRLNQLRIVSKLSKFVFKSLDYFVKKILLFLVNSATY